MFVGRTGLCHDDEDPVECSGGRKLFYTAYGDPICDCPPGHFPYPNSRDNCLALFTQGPCRDGLVLSFSSTGEFICELEGQQQTSSSQQEDVLIGDEFSRLLPADDGLYYPLGSSGPCRPSFLFDYDVLQLKSTCTAVENGDNDGHHYLDDQLLNPCRPGIRNGNNFKCSNSFLYDFLIILHLN